MQIIALAVPVAAYFWFIGNYALNVIYYDSWSDIHTIAKPSLIWAQHNENRIFFPNLIVLLLAYTTHYSVVFEEFLSGAMLVTATALFVWAHKRRSPATPWLYYCPVAIVMLSFVQAGDTLWGFQLAWYLVTLALAVMLFAIDRPTLTGIAFTAAIAAAVVGSFSSLQGLLIWPVGLALLWHRCRPKKFLYAWVASAVVTAAVYFYGFDFGAATSNNSYGLSHPIAAIKVFFFVIGGVFGENIVDNTGNLIPNVPYASTGVVIFLGVVVFAIAAWVIVVYGVRRDDAGPGPVGAAMASFGILCILTIAVGRTSATTNFTGGASRYTMFTLLILAGCCLALLSRPIQRARSTEAGQRELTRIRSYPIVRWVLIGTVCLLVVLGTLVGVDYGRYWHQREEVMADVTVNLHKVPDSTVSRYLFPGGAQYVRPWTRIAATRHLSLFATGAVSHYSKEGLFKELTSVQTRVLRPKPGAVLSGIETFDAAATSQIGISRVEYRLTGGSFHETPIAAGFQTFFGWVARWNSMSVPDGTYSLQSVAYASDGRVSASAGIVVTVKNRH